MSFPIYFVKGKEKNNSKCWQLRWHIIMAREPPLQCCHCTSGSSWQHQQALKLGEKSRLCQLRFLIFCQKGRFCAVRTRSVSGCWPLAWLWSPRLEGWGMWCCAGGCWRVALCYPKQSKQKTGTSGVLRTLEEGTKLTLLTSFLSLYLYFIDVCWENMRQLVEGILILYWDIN